MAITTGYGFRPIQLLGGKAFSGGTIREFVVTPAAATNPICTGDLVTEALGVVLTVATAPAAGTVSTNTPIGVCVGVRFTDPVLKQTQHSQFLPATSTGYTNIFAKVVDDPDVLFQVRYEGTLTYANIGRNCTLTYAAGSTTTGNSLAYATGMATTNTLPFRIVDIVQSLTDSNGAAVTDIIVKYNANTHAYHQVLGQ
jgi:hypothetical protein